MSNFKQKRSDAGEITQYMKALWPSESLHQRCLFALGKPHRDNGSRAEDREPGLLQPFLPHVTSRVSFGCVKEKPGLAKGSSSNFIDRNKMYSFPGSHTHFWPIK